MLQGTCGKISQISVQSSRDAELVNRRQLETIFMKSYFGTTDWEQYQPKITWVLLLSPVTVFFQHKLTISLDSKICTQRCNKRVISSKSLFILSVNNDQFNYYRILSDYTYTKSRKLFDNIITGFGILLLVLIFGQVYSLLRHF